MIISVHARLRQVHHRTTRGGVRGPPGAAAIRTCWVGVSALARVLHGTVVNNQRRALCDVVGKRGITTGCHGQGVHSGKWQAPWPPVTFCGLVVRLLRTGDGGKAYWHKRSSCRWIHSWIFFFFFLDLEETNVRMVHLLLRSFSTTFPFTCQLRCAFKTCYYAKAQTITRGLACALSSDSFFLCGAKKVRCHFSFTRHPTKKNEILTTGSVLWQQKQGKRHARKPHTPAAVMVAHRVIAQAATRAVLG